MVFAPSSLEKVPETGRWRFMDINPKFEAQVSNNEVFDTTTDAYDNDTQLDTLVG